MLSFKICANPCGPSATHRQAVMFTASAVGPPCPLPAFPVGIFAQGLCMAVSRWMRRWLPTRRMKLLREAGHPRSTSRSQREPLASRVVCASPSPRPHSASAVMAVWGAVCSPCTFPPRPHPHTRTDGFSFFTNTAYCAVPRCSFRLEVRCTRECPLQAQPPALIPNEQRRLSTRAHREGGPTCVS